MTNSRVLFVSNADSPHLISWSRLLLDSEFAVRIFTIPLRKSMKPFPAWKFPVYSTIQPDKTRQAKEVHWLLPNFQGIKTLVHWIEDRFSISAKYLKWVIRTWKPDIIHSVPLDTGSKLARQALEGLAQEDWPIWVASAWGNDMYLGYDDPQSRPNIEFVMKNCNGFFADCNRDLRIAQEVGLSAEKLALPEAVPGSGGLSIDYFSDLRQRSSKRNIILLPKAFERTRASGNRTLPVIEALNHTREYLDEYEIHLVKCSYQVRTYLRKMPESFQQRFHLHNSLEQHKLFELMGKTKIMIAPSLSDGTPNVMLEAMGAGALPIVSPIESIEEWIVDGENGLLVHALYPNQIAAAIQRGLSDDKLFRRAQKKNWEIITQRADRSKVRKQIMTYYRGLLK